MEIIKSSLPSLLKWELFRGASGAEDAINTVGAYQLTGDLGVAAAAYVYSKINQATRVFGLYDSFFSKFIEVVTFLGLLELTKNPMIAIGGVGVMKLIALANVGRLLINDRQYEYSNPYEKKGDLRWEYRGKLHANLMKKWFDANQKEALGLYYRANGPSVSMNITNRSSVDNGQAGKKSDLDVMVTYWGFDPWPEGAEKTVELMQECFDRLKPPFEVNVTTIPLTNAVSPQRRDSTKF